MTTNTLHNELIYCASYLLLKNLLEAGQINKRDFNRLNQMNAEKMNCRIIRP